MRKAAASTPVLSKFRRRAFTALAVSLPFLVILLLEAGLRFFDYGGSQDMFVLQGEGDNREFVLNPAFVKRYSFKKGLTTPTPLSQRFTASKDSSTYRIFCLGASTTLGFPYPPGAAFPASLKRILMSLHPEKPVEVINCGVTAITSHCVLDMGREILDRYAPDLLVVYTGHNEFYGVFGQASQTALFENRNLIKAAIAMHRSRTFLLMKNIMISVFGRQITQDDVIDHKTMMGSYAQDVGIEIHSPLFNRTEEHFRANLTELIHEAKRRGTSILLSNLVSNLADLPPFSSNSLTPYDKLTGGVGVKEAVELARQHQSNGEFNLAIEAYREALKMDSTAAGVHYQLAKCLDALGDSRLAAHHYIRARDFDLIRFRAPSSFNRIIEKVSAELGIPSVDAAAEFEARSASGIPGQDLFWEHVHPKQEGYLHLARAVARTMAEHRLIADNWDWRLVEEDSTYLAAAGLTLLDKEVANYTIFKLTSHWPFPDSRQRSYVRLGDDRTESLARQIITDGSTSLVKAHLDLGLEFYNAGQVDQALAEYLSALQSEPLCELYSRIGLLYGRKTELAFKDHKDYQAAADNFARAFSYFRTGLKRCPDHIGLIYNKGLLFALRNDQTEVAVDDFKRVLDLDPEHINAARHLGRLYIRRKEFDKARVLFLEAYKKHPEEVEFPRSLGFVFARQNRFEEAEEWLNRALEVKPADAMTKHFLNQLRARQRGGS